MFLRKRHAGSDSHGHVWAHDGAVVEVADHLAAELLAIVDAGFTVAEPPHPYEPPPADPPADHGDATVPDPPTVADVTEVAPDAAPVAETPKPRRARKTA